MVYKLVPVIRLKIMTKYEDSIKGTTKNTAKVSTLEAGPVNNQRLKLQCRLLWDHNNSRDCF